MYPSSVRPSVRKKRANHRMYLRRSRCQFTTVIFSVDFQGAEKNCVCAVKEGFAGTLKKSTFFDLLIIQIVLNYGAQDRSEASSLQPSWNAAVLERNCHRAPAQPTGLQKVGSRANFGHVNKQLAGQNVRTLCELCPNRKSVGMLKRENFPILGFLKISENQFE